MYSVKYVCSNCGYSFSQSFSWGLAAPERIICPHCGNHSAKKNLWPGQETNKKWQPHYYDNWGSISWRK